MVRTMIFSAPAFIECATAQGIPRFTMVAYTGSAMRVKGFPHPVAVDLNGLMIPKGNIPIRLDHEPRQGVGHTTRIAVENGQLIAEGLISRETSWAKDVAQSGENGFPWQASIGGPIYESEEIPEGGSVEVNGQTLAGPLNVIRKMELREISFVDAGADARTSVRVEGAFACEKGAERKKRSTEKKKKEISCAADDELEKELVEEERLEAMASFRRELAFEKERIAKIESIGQNRFPELEAEAIRDGWESDRFELAYLRRARPEAPAIRVEKPKVNASVLEAAALGASGFSGQWLESRFDEPTLEASEKLRGIGLQEFCELASGRRLPRFRRDAHGWLEAAFSTASLPGILSNVANKMLLEGYNYVEDSWRSICRISSVTDFKAHSRYRMTGSFQFEKVGADGELKHGTIDEQTYYQKADTHGIMFALTRQMMIDDDLGALTDIPRQIGIGAAEAIADAVWSLLLSNPIQPDNRTFFHAQHGNLITGEDSALSINALTAAEIKFGEQTKPNGRPLGATPSILLVPTALKVLAELLMKSTTLNENTTVPHPNMNPHTGKYKIVSSAYLGNGYYSGSSSKAWYLLADPNRLPALEVAFLGGLDRPTIERADADFNTLGIQFRGYIDFGVREQDWRGALKSAGE